MARLLSLVLVILIVIIVLRVTRSPQERGAQMTAPPMTRKEALEVLGLGPEASNDDISKAYKNLMRRNHPDTGGSAYLATKLNEARRVLLG